MTPGQSLVLLAVGVVAGGAVGYFAGLVVGHNRGANFQRITEAIKQTDRLAQHLANRFTVLQFQRTLHPPDSQGGRAVHQRLLELAEVNAVFHGREPADQALAGDLRDRRSSCESAVAEPS